MSDQTTEPKLIPQTIMLRADTYEYYEKESVHAELEHIKKRMTVACANHNWWMIRDLIQYIESVFEGGKR